MTQVFNVSINNLLAVVGKCTISEEINRFYDVAFFEIKEVPEPNSSVIINYGDKTFTGFVYSTSKLSKLLYRVECRTEGAKLTEPYSTYTKGYDEAVGSHELCALYATQSGIPINITAENINFGGSYERTGTMLSALSNIANVTGAEYWDDGTSIQIQPNKAITDAGVEVPPAQIFDFVASSKSVYNKGVGFITIRNGGSEASDIISTNGIYAEVEECTGDIFVYPNPNGDIESTKGLSNLTPIHVERNETSSLLDQDLIRLDGAIESINLITLNGASISDYNFEQGHNVIYFNTLKRGTLTVNYKAYGYKGHTNIQNTAIGRFISFDIFYLNQVIKFEGFLLAECLNYATDGDMTCIVPSDMYYNQGFDVWTIGGDPVFKLYDKNVEIIRDIIHSSEDPYISVEDVTLELMGTGNYRYRPNYDIVNVLGVKSAEITIPYTLESDDDGDFFQFTQYYPKVRVSYEVLATKHTVQFSNIEYGEITLVILNSNTNQICEYDLEAKLLCEFNQYVPVDVATELGMLVTSVKGASLPYVNPDASAGSVIVDEFGMVKIWVFMDGHYLINTRSLKTRTTITLTSKVNG